MLLGRCLAIGYNFGVQIYPFRCFPQMSVEVLFITLPFHLMENAETGAIMRYHATFTRLFAFT
jgi:hypothetical protein